MGKLLKYQMLTIITDHNGNEIDHRFSNVEMGWNEANEEIAKREAYNGKYTIVDDEHPEVYQPTTEERLAALEAAQLEMLGVMVDG